jgi:uncharacterized protein
MIQIAEKHLPVTDSEAKALNLLARHMLAEFGERVVDIILFGSKARGESSPESDIDVLVVLRNPSAQDLKQAGGIGFDVWSESGVFLALQVIDEADWNFEANMQTLFYLNLQRDGVSLLPLDI